MSKAQRSEPIPIFRSFESNGVKYIAGYAALFDSEDSYGTAMTREAVESSQEHLQSFPAVRFMHRVPFGQIDFENEVQFEGKSFRTFINDHGFHVLCRIYDECTNEWNMVKAGKWGFSYGFMPDAQGGTQTRKLANGHTVPAFVKGIFYEVSVVDAPSHSDAIAYVISRMIDANEEPQTRSAEEDQAILQSIPRNSRLGQVLDRLDTLEKNIAEAEKIVKDPIIHMHVAKNRPNFCKPKRLDGFDEE